MDILASDGCRATIYTMFKPATPKVADLAKQRPDVIQQLERLLVGRVSMYIDYANVRPWSEKLGWHIDLKRLHQFLTSFDTIKRIGFYYGTLQNDPRSLKLIQDARDFGYEVRTKPVKLLRLSIDVSSINPDSPELLRQFIRGSLLRELDVGTIQYLNAKLQALNRLGTRELKDYKCNFDVEIGRDMVIASERKEAEGFVLWSGDSDFHDPLQALLRAGRHVVLFATVRKVASELSELQSEGLVVFDIAKLKTFICWNRELTV